MRRDRAVRPLVTLFAVLLLVAAGCSEDEGPILPFEVIEIRQGTWLTSRTVTYQGPDTCVALETSWTDSTQILCFIDPVAGSGRQLFSCSVDQEGETVSYECFSVLDTGPCFIRWDLTGGGTVTDSTFELQGSLVQTTEGDSILCAEYAFPCTSNVVYTGTFVSTLGDSICAGLFGSGSAAGRLLGP
jgi:hypothetical protein